MQMLERLSNLELVAYAALCLHQFCRAKRIEHPCIDELLEHLLTMLISDTLDGWERKLAGLDLSGDGDPIPAELEALIPGDTLDDFCRLVDCVVEVGVGDLYAASSKGPLNDLLRCLEILDATGVERPDIPEIFKTKTRTSAAPYTGETYSQQEYEQVRMLFDLT